MTVMERLKEIVVEQLDVKPEAVIPEANFQDNLGADSLDMVGIPPGDLEALAGNQFHIEFGAATYIQRLTNRFGNDNLTFAGGPYGFHDTPKVRQ